MFRITDNVPEVYVQESRDFQLLSRAFDIAFVPTKYNIDSLRDSINPARCNERLLELHKTKVGLFNTLDVSDDALRLIIDAFPWIIRHKGSIQGIMSVVNLYLRIEKRSDCNITLDINALAQHKIKLKCINIAVNQALLSSLLYYIIPTGYKIEYAYESNPIQSSINTSDQITVKRVLETAVPSKESDLVLTVGLTKVINTNDNKESGNSNIEESTINEQ